MLEDSNINNKIIKTNKINIYEMSDNIKQYLLTLDSKDSNGFVIRILDEDNENSNYERRRSYIITFPVTRSPYTGV